jgi:hypothetical protein
MSSNQQAQPPILTPSPKSLRPEEQPNPPTPNERLTVHNWKDAEMVTAVVPKLTKLQLPDGEGIVTFYPGVQEIPRQLINHWWLKANGIKAYAKGAQTAKPAADDPAQPLPKMTERELGYIQSLGVHIETVPQAQQYFEQLEPLARGNFLANAQAWAVKKAAEEKDGEDEVPGGDVDLSKLTKAQLTDHAEEHHGIVLDPNSMTKDELVAEIEKLRKR